MAFYIKPPKGIISRRKLQKYAEKRFRFLTDLISCKDDKEKLDQLLKEVSTIYGSECLITGSQCDKLSHFIVRLVLCDSPARAEWFVKAEVALFKIRFDAQTEVEKKQCLIEAQHQITKFSSFQPCSYKRILLTLKSICKLLRIKKHANVTFKVPFEHALSFVRSRQLPLQNGQVTVPVQKIKDLLLSLHELILYEGIQQMKSSNCAANAKSDSRIKDISNQLQCHFVHQIQSTKPFGIILARDVDGICQEFPPCMLHLFKLLKQRHRLQHSAREQQMNEISHFVHHKKYKDACLHYLMAQDLNKSDITSQALCSSISSKMRNINNISIQFSGERIAPGYAHNNNNASDQHKPDTSLQSDSNKFIRTEHQITGTKCDSSEALHSNHAHRKLVFPPMVIHKPVDYFKSFQLLLKGIGENNSCTC